MTNLKNVGCSVARGLVPADVCDTIRNAFHAEVKPYNLPLLRQRSVAYENHEFSSGKLMTNALLDVHRSLDSPYLQNLAVRARR